MLNLLAVHMNSNAASGCESIPVARVRKPEAECRRQKAVAARKQQVKANAVEESI